MLTVLAEVWRSSRWRWLGEGRSGLQPIPCRSSCERQVVLFDDGGDVAVHPKAKQRHGQMRTVLGILGVSIGRLGVVDSYQESSSEARQTVAANRAGPC